MKFFLFILVTSSSAFSAPVAQKKVLPVSKEEEMVKQDKVARAKLANEKLKMLDKKEEDCDKKSKKPVEIKPESISLTGNAGCSLPE
jgi:hypothetical protein